MVCAYCGQPTQVINSRAQKRNNQVWRRRRCKTCKALFTTHEALDLTSALFVDVGGLHKPFMGDLLYTELLLALQDQKNCYETARDAQHTIIRRLRKLPSFPFVKPRQISQESAKVLKRLNQRAYLRYLAEHPSLQAES